MLRIIFQERLGWNAIDLGLRRDLALSESELLQVYLPLKRLRSGEPLQYVLGTTDFHGLRLEVGPGVLIPRPETEELIDLILRSGIRPGSIVDIGTGSGCIALALKNEFQDSTVIGMDVSPQALRIAARNSDRLQLAVEWKQADILDPQFQFPANVDLIVSNPPYVPLSESSTLATQVRDHEPHLALFVADDDPLLFYRAIAKHAREQMASGGTLWFEGHYQYSRAVADLLREMKFHSVELHKDLSGNDRFIEAQI